MNLGVMFDRMVSTIERIRWYHRKHGFGSLVRRSAQRLVNRWIIRSQYLFAVNLDRDTFLSVTDSNPLTVTCYCSMEAIPPEDMKQLIQRKGQHAVTSFLRHFFDYGARLWLARLNGDIVGLKWILKGGFQGFYCIPVLEREVVSLAGQVFEDFRGQRIWERMTGAILDELRREGVSRVYFGVHCRNKPMLRAVAKAGIPAMGKLLTISLWRIHITIWDRHSLRIAASRQPPGF